MLSGISKKERGMRQMGHRFIVKTTKQQIRNHFILGQIHTRFTLEFGVNLPMDLRRRLS